MSERIDINLIAAELTRGSRLHELDEVTVERGTIELDDSCLLVDGDVLPGAVITGIGSVVVRGKVEGSERWPARIEVEGDVVIVGAASYARIQGRQVCVGGDADCCTLRGRTVVQVSETVRETSVKVGECEPERREILSLQHAIRERESELDYEDRLLKLAQKRLSKTISTTRIALDSGVGGMINQKRRSVEVNLSPFYKVTDGLQPKAIDRALDEFFAKAVVGRITAANSGFIRGNKNRQTVLLSLIRNLHELFRMTRKVDVAREALQQVRTDFGKRVLKLESRDTSLAVGGVTPNVDITFCAPVIDLGEDERSDVKIETCTTSASVRDDDGNTVFEGLLDASGSPVASADGLSDAAIVLKDGAVRLAEAPGVPA